MDETLDVFKMMHRVGLHSSALNTNLREGRLTGLITWSMFEPLVSYALPSAATTQMYPGPCNSRWYFFPRTPGQYRGFARYQATRASHNKSEATHAGDQAKLCCKEFPHVMSLYGLL